MPVPPKILPSQLWPTWLRSDGSMRDLASLRTGETADPWDVARSLMGYEPDTEIARRTGLGRGAIQYRRERMGIPQTGARNGPAPERGATADRRLTMRLTPNEHAAMTAAAGEEPISTWGRRQMRLAAGMDPE